MRDATTTGVPGLKDDPIPPFAPQATGVGIGSLLQMLVALAIVVAIVRFVVPKYAKRLALRGTELSSPDLQVKHSINVGSGQILLVEARGKNLLIGSTTQGLSLLADLSEDNSPQTTSDLRFEEFDAMLTRLTRLEN